MHPYLDLSPQRPLTQRSIIVLSSNAPLLNKGQENPFAILAFIVIINDYIYVFSVDSQAKYPRFHLQCYTIQQRTISDLHTIQLAKLEVKIRR